MAILWASINGEVIYRHPSFRELTEEKLQEAMRAQKEMLEAAPAKVNL